MENGGGEGSGQGVCAAGNLSRILTGGKTVNHSGSPCLERSVFPTLKQEVKQVMGWM